MLITIKSLSLMRKFAALAICAIVGVPSYSQIIEEAEDNKPKKFVQLTVEEPKLTFFQGFTLSADVFGPIQYLMSDYGSFEGALRLNLYNTYFPIAELGFANCDMTDGNTNISYKTSAPYLRVGVDMNILKNKFQENRLFVGVRYGISNYKYDYSGPVVSDPVWNGNYQLSLDGITATSHWAELVLGAQVKIWRNFHMGWSVRLKTELSTTKNLSSKPHYIPGYGTTTSGTSWGGTYSLIFDVDWGKKNRVKRVIETPVEVKVDVDTPNDTINTSEQEPSPDL